MEESTEQSWRALSEEILSGMKEWRLAHPKATLREIEQTASELVSRLQTRMVQDSAMSSPLADWQGLAPEQRPTCPACATALVPRGKRKRRLPGSGGRAVELIRGYGTCPSCGMGLFPLDDELALVPGRFTPTQEEHLVHLAAWMPFARAATLLQEIIGVQVSETTARRHTEQAGEAYVQVQTEQWQLAVHLSDEQQAAAAKLALSSDGASFPLVQGQWAEVRTLAIGVVEQTDEHVHTSHLSSFSRMVDAATCATWPKWRPGGDG